MRHHTLPTFLLALALTTVASVAAPTGADQRLRTSDRGRIVVAPDRRHLAYEDGTPFFWLGDTAWELFHRLTLAEIERYLDNRRAKGFTVIQAVVLAEMNGLRKPNAYGHVPFVDLDPGRPNEQYFELVDQVVRMAGDRGLVVGLLPTWGDKVTQAWGEGPVVFDEETAQAYGRWIGKRYAAVDNIVWILGGDRPARNGQGDWRPTWRAMARAIREATNGRALITYHTSGGSDSTSQQMHDEPWLDVNTMQSGHGAGHDVPVWEWIARDRALTPPKPTLDAEPNYEDHPVNPWPTWSPENGYFRDHDVRKQTYRSVFAGACGVTYGHHAVWQFWSPREEKINHADRYWTEALDRPGAFQVGHLRRLVESRPLFGRVPDPGLIAEGQGTGGEHVVAYRAGDGSYAMVYIPRGKPIVVRTDALSGTTLNVWWFDPRTAAVRAEVPRTRSAQMRFEPPSAGPEDDWVLVLDDAARRYGAPALVTP